MKQISIKQQRKNRELSLIKSELEKECFICGKYGDDLAHILPKSLYPEYYIRKENLIILCRYCHNLYDNDISFRIKQEKLFERAKQIDEKAAIKYFKKY